MEWIIRLFQGFTEWCLLGPTCKVDWEAWSSIATGLAVLVALLTSWVGIRSTRRENELQRSHAAAEERRRNDENAERLALVFEHELFLLGSQIQFLLQSAPDAQVEGNPIKTITVLHSFRQFKGFTILERSVDHLNSFGPEVAAKLMMVLSGWYALANGPTPPVEFNGIPPQFVTNGARAMRRAMVQLVAAVIEARQAIRPWASRHRTDFPEIDNF